MGHVRIEPMPNVTVDVYVTHTAANDYNSYYREIQVRMYWYHTGHVRYLYRYHI